MGGLIVGILAMAATLAAAQLHPTPYNNFVLLAQAFLHGRVWIDFPGGYIDALPFNGKYYIIEAPLPAILLLPAVAIFGQSTNQEVLAALLAGAGCGATWEMARRLGTPRWARAVLCGFLMLGTDFMWCATFGDVWFIAHVSSVAFTMLALLELTGARPRGWLIALFAACAVESRFAMVVALPFYALLLLFDHVVPRIKPKPIVAAAPIAVVSGAAPTDVVAASDVALVAPAPGEVDSLASDVDGTLLTSSHAATPEPGEGPLTAEEVEAPAAAPDPVLPAPAEVAVPVAAGAPAVAARPMRERLRSVASFAAVLVPFAIAWVAYNYARWGVPYDIGYTAWYHQDQAGEPTGSPFRLEYFPMQVQSFFLQFPDRTSDWPYFRPGFGGVALTWTSPALVFALLARGPWRTIGVMWLLTLAAAFPNFIYYVNGYAQFGMRHALDFEPFLVVLMALAFRTNVVTAIATLPVVYSMFVGGWGIWYWKTFFRQH